MVQTDSLKDSSRKDQMKRKKCVFLIIIFYSFLVVFLKLFQFNFKLNNDESYNRIFSNKNVYIVKTTKNITFKMISTQFSLMKNERNK